MADPGDETHKEQRATNAVSPDANSTSSDHRPNPNKSAQESSAIEQQLSGAVRRAVTDVLKTNQRQPDLPAIDMDFVVGGDKAAATTVKRERSVSPSQTHTAFASRHREHATADTAISARARSRSMIIGGGVATVLALVAVAAALEPSFRAESNQTSIANASSTPTISTSNRDVNSEVAALKAAAKSERMLLEAKLEANRVALAEAKKQAALQQRKASSLTSSSAAERALLEAQLAAKRAALAEAESMARLRQQEAAEEKAETQADRLLLDAKRAAVEEAERRIALQNETAVQQRAAAEAERLLQEERQSARDAAAKRQKTRQQATMTTDTPDTNTPDNTLIETTPKPSPSVTSNSSSETPADDHKVRLKLEQILIAARKEAGTLVPHLQTGPMLARRAVTLQLKNSNLNISGELKSHNSQFFVIILPTREEISLPVQYFDCQGSNCPTPQQRDG